MYFFGKNVNNVVIGKYLRTFCNKFDNAGPVLKAVRKFSWHQYPRKKKPILMSKLLAFEHTTLLIACLLHDQLIVKLVAYVLDL